MQLGRKREVKEMAAQEAIPQAVVMPTGQVGCWDTRGNPVQAKGSGQDGASGATFKADRFKDNGNGTISDLLTGLIWLQDADLFSEVSWEDALRKARQLSSGAGELKDDSKPGQWRLPNIREMLSLIDYGMSDPIIPKNKVFKNVRTAIYWTSTSLFPAAKLSWMMTLGIGPTVFDIKLPPNKNRMWPVRNDGDSRVLKTGQTYCFDVDGNPVDPAGTGQDGELQAGFPLPPGKDRFADNNDGTVTDKLTGLVWLRNANPFGPRVWQEALDLCNSLASGEYGLTDGSVPGDWSLPNIREAESVVDYGQVGPCLPTDHPFQGLRPSSYWTSTSVTAAPTEAMFIIYGVGPSIFESKEHPFFVWPVKRR
jgi:Protein of unknown function (DUF1566)